MAPIKVIKKQIQQRSLYRDLSCDLHGEFLRSLAHGPSMLGTLEALPFQEELVLKATA